VKSLIESKYELFQKLVDTLTCITAIEGTQISKIKRLDEAFVKTGVQLMVEEVLMTFGALDKVSQLEVKKIVSKILASYWWLKLEEVAYVFNKGKNLHYGKVYGTPNEATFIDWLNLYDNSERGIEIDNQNKALKDSINIGSKLSDAELDTLYKTKNINDPAFPDESRRMEERTEAIAAKVKQMEYANFREQYLKEKREAAEKNDQPHI
jgi:hypothetical protein